MADIKKRVFLAAATQEADTRVIASPFQFWFSGEDNLRVEGWSALTGVTLFIHGRVLSEANQIEAFTHTLALTADRVRVQRDFAMGKGFLLNLVVVAGTAAPKIGQTFARVTVIRGLTGATLVLGTLLQGYVTSQQGLGWPGSPIQTSIEGAGCSRFIIGTTPAAGAQVNEIVPTGARWALQAFHVSFAASGAAGTRSAYLLLSSGAIAAYAQTHPQAAVAGSTPDWYWARGVNTETVINNSYVTAALPTPIFLSHGHQIGVVVVNIDAADQLSNVRFLVEEWLEVD